MYNHGTCLSRGGVVVADKCPLVVGRESARWLAVEEPELGAPPALAALAERPSLALLLKKMPDREGDVIALARRALFGEEDGVSSEEGAKVPPTVAAEVRADGVPGLLVPADRHRRAAVLDILFPKMVCAVVEPPSVAEPPHVALMFGAWQRRAVLSAAALPHVAPKVLRHGFYSGIDIEHPQLLSKTVDEYELRPDKDYAETIVLMVAVGAAEPALAEPDQVDGPPPELLELGPIHVSEDAVVGATECERFFPAGYDAPKPTPKPKEKKKKKGIYGTAEPLTVRISPTRQIRYELTCRTILTTSEYTESEGVTKAHYTRYESERGSSDVIAATKINYVEGAEP
ncbi:hypothetical protein EVAR_8967_1 [Eumeta japonica]|uniref:DUF4746 domain-containing protein n=1 Tax=Eumeta variegata TaxID=151549 RepID=A0A4C1WQQ6_EUMVA|nr:hypothetical protein EVAR_8967_1 [Eumeta japonica]